MDKKISELTEITTPSSADLLPIVDVSAGETKKITISNLKGDLQSALDSKQNKFILTVGSSNADYITDGIDDDVQIQQAIDAVGIAGGGQVIIKAGTYVLGDGLVIDSPNVHLKGVGIGATILQAKTAFPTNTALITTDENNLSVSELTIDGNKANQTTENHIGIWDDPTWNGYTAHYFNLEIKNINYNSGDYGMGLFMNGERARVSNCYFHNNEGSGLFSYAYRGVINNCVSESNGDDGFHIYGESHTLTGCLSLLNGEDGFEVRSDFNTISGCNTRENTGYGYNVSAKSNTVDGCAAFLDVGGGIKLASGGSIVADCAIASEKHGVEVVGYGDNTITGCVINARSLSADNTYSGVYLTGSTVRNVITGNRIYKESGTNDFEYGIRESGTGSDYNVIKNNIVTDAQTAQISIQGVNTITDGGVNVSASKGFVNHGATAGTARPVGFTSVEWYGSVEPENAIEGDTWIEA